MLLAEVLMADLAHCDLGDGIEVVHDVEAVEVEMDCDVAMDAIDEDADDTIRFAHPEFDLDPDAGTHQYARMSAPYERIELWVDPQAYVRATIEEAKELMRARTRS